jgi:hypothetical protein
MSDQSIGITCPFTLQEYLPLPNLPKDDPWYGIVPEMVETKNFNIWYFNVNMLNKHGWAWIINQLLKPKIEPEAKLIETCWLIAHRIQNLGHIYQQGEWVFMKVAKDPIFFF